MDELIAAIRKGICCQGRECHVEEVKRREAGKYLTDLPCYALGPDVGDSLRAVLAAIEAKGYAVVPKDAAPGVEAQQCWNLINAMIVPGPLSGNGWDRSAQRNGLILAANAILAEAERLRKAALI